MKLAESLDELRIVPRFIALLLAISSVALLWKITDVMLADGINGTGELTAITAVLVAMITSSVSVVAMLGKQEGK